MNLDTIRAALEYVSADDRDTWLMMAMAIKSEFGDPGFDVWDAWSRRGRTYDAADAIATWQSIEAEGGVTIRTLFYEAQRNGFNLTGLARWAPPTPEVVAHRERRRREVAELQQRTHKAAAEKAAAVWGAASVSCDGHPYLLRKRVQPVPSLRELHVNAVESLIGYFPKQRDEFLTGRVLIVPVKIDDELSTVEFIDERGRKTALAGGAKAGGYWAPAPLPGSHEESPKVLIGEGVATVMTVHQATGYASAAALSSTNLRRVANSMRQRYPSSQIVLLADRGNGERQAHQAAQIVGGLVAVPSFVGNERDDATDFNDLAELRGQDEVGRAVANAAAPTLEENAVELAKLHVTALTGVPATNGEDANSGSGSKDDHSNMTSGADERMDEGSDIPRDAGADIPETSVTAVTGVQADNHQDSTDGAVVDGVVTGVTPVNRPHPDSDARPAWATHPHDPEHGVTAVSAVTGEQAPDDKGLDCADGCDEGASSSAGTGAETAGEESSAAVGSSSGPEPKLSEHSDAKIPPAHERPCFKVFHGSVPGCPSPAGVWYFDIKAGKPGTPGVLPQQWICSPIVVDAVTFDSQENNFGRLLRLTNTLGRVREWAMPMELLRGAGDELRGELLSMGVHIEPLAHRRLSQYFQENTPTRRVRCALQVGWCGDSFVLPDEVIGPSASAVIFQSGERGHDEYTVGGTLVEWQSQLAASAVRNPLLMLALSAAFAGPLLSPCNAEGGGIHLVGDSSTGKTTVIEAACSVWGGANYRRSWRATANGMEGAASLFNDGLLALDEISECEPRDVGLIVYALANGRGKQRASRTGNARNVNRWRCFVISSGERTIGTAMMEGGFRPKAGQSVRLLDIPSSRIYGAWDDLHGFATGAALSDAIRRAAVTHHGCAGRAFLQRLTRDPRNFSGSLERLNALPEFRADGREGQAKRAATRFALLALAGELATEYGITGWPEGAALAAAADGFKAWASLRGHRNDEPRDIVDRVTAFIELHGDSRFSEANSGAENKCAHRAGWWRDEDGVRIYLFNTAGLREAVKGFDFKRALDTLQHEGVLPESSSGERSKPLRIDGRVVRVYPINAEKLGTRVGN